MPFHAGGGAKTAREFVDYEEPGVMPGVDVVGPGVAEPNDYACVRLTARWFRLAPKNGGSLLLGFVLVFGVVRNEFGFGEFFLVGFFLFGEAGRHHGGYGQVDLVEHFRFGRELRR